MFFVTISNVEVNFNNPELRQISYIIVEAISTIKKIKLVGKKKFAAATFDLENEAFVIHVASIVSTTSNPVHPFCRFQIALLKADEAPTAILLKYTNFTDIFSLDLKVQLIEHTRINNYTIK